MLFSPSQPHSPTPEVRILVRRTLKSHTIRQSLSTWDSNSAIYQRQSNGICNEGCTRGSCLLSLGCGTKNRLPSRGRFDKVMGARVYHNFCSRIDFGVDLLLQLSQSLEE